MKRLWLVMLCLCIVLTGCLNKKGDDNEETLPEPEVDAINRQTDPLRMSKEWTSIETVVNNRPAFTMHDYEANVTPYKIDNNLSNIENMDRFTGFTDEQKKMLVENGFVVLPSQDTKMYYVYDQNEYLGVPNFITADSVLHTFHQFYNKSLMHVESSYLYDDLHLMTKQMLDKSINVYKVLEDEQLKKLQANNVIYFLVAQMLMEPSVQQIDGVDEEFWKVAKQEIELIEKAESFIKSPLFKIDLDYSQFKIRGHYTRTEELGRFFQTMMWYGTAPLSFFDREGEFLYENTLQALLLSFTTFLQSKDTDDIKLWANIYVPTGQYVGLSDDIHVFQMNDVRLSVYGEGNDPNIFNDKKYYDQLLEVVKKLPEPKIQAMFTEASGVSTPTEKQFRFMGQRYILDSYIMQKLMMPVLRPVPSGLDVMGVLGSNLAENLLFTVLKPQQRWLEYEERYRHLATEVSGYTEVIWGENLYNGWLWAIQETLTEFAANSGMPFFMMTDAWKHKSLNAALGSYTELKHDTVLYGKQPAAQMGGPLDFDVQHYVEPNVPLYSKLLYLTDYTISVLEERGMMNETFLNGANKYKDLLEFLIECSIKELRNEALTEEENSQLIRYGGKLEYIASSFLLGFTEDYNAIELNDMLVTDVAIIAPSSNLSMGTGFFDHIYVVVPVDGKLFLARGSVYSYYEFLNDTRLTDEEWWALHGVQQVQADFGPYLEWTEPSEALPNQPFWVDTFKSNSNRIEIEPMEVDWNKLNE